MFLKHVCASCTRRRERTGGPWLRSLLRHELWRKRGFPCVCAWNGIVHSLCHISACLTRQNKSFSIFQSAEGLTERGSGAVLPRLCFLLSRPFLSVVPSVLSPPVLWSAPLSSWITPSCRAPPQNPLHHSASLRQYQLRHSEANKN